MHDPYKVSLACTQALVALTCNQESVCFPDCV